MDYENYPPKVRQILDAGLGLTKQNLGYTYGSADPKNGGMDCSGFIYYVLQQNGFREVPRDSSQQYVWVRKAGDFDAVLSRKEDSFELDDLKPGDLLFWRGTYNIDRDPPITHTMIYLGREKRTKKRVMVGSSDGRTYDGIQRWGVSVFDFKMPPPPKSGDAKISPVFVGYGRIPGLSGELRHQMFRGPRTDLNGRPFRGLHSSANSPMHAFRCNADEYKGTVEEMQQNDCPCCDPEGDWPPIDVGASPDKEYRSYQQPS